MKNFSFILLTFAVLVSGCVNLTAVLEPYDSSIVPPDELKVRITVENEKGFLYDNPAEDVRLKLDSNSPFELVLSDPPASTIFEGKTQMFNLTLKAKPNADAGKVPVHIKYESNGEEGTLLPIFEVEIIKPNVKIFDIPDRSLPESSKQIYITLRNNDLTSWDHMSMQIHPILENQGYFEVLNVDGIAKDFERTVDGWVVDLDNVSSGDPKIYLTVKATSPSSYDLKFQIKFTLKYKDEVLVDEKTEDFIAKKTV